MKLKTFSLSGESRCYINGQTLFTSHRNYIIEANTKAEAISKFKTIKKSVKQIKATEIK